MKYIKKILVFIIIWVIVQGILHYIFNPSGIEGYFSKNIEYQQAMSSVWIFLIILFSVFNIWNNKKSLLWKIGIVILNWIGGSIVGSILGMFFGESAIGMMIVAFFIFVASLFQEKKQIEK